MKCFFYAHTSQRPVCQVNNVVSAFSTASNGITLHLKGKKADGTDRLVNIINLPDGQIEVEFPDCSTRMVFTCYNITR